MPKIMILVAITPPDHAPVSNGSGATDSIPGIIIVSDDNTNAGKITDTKLISTIDMENRNTIHGIIVLFVPESVLLSFFCFIKHILAFLLA